MSYIHLLRECALQHGPDLDRWPEQARRDVVVRFYEHDEACERPDWMGDALAESVSSRKWRDEVLKALRATNVADASVHALTALRTALYYFPVDHLSRICHENYGVWMADAVRELGVADALSAAEHERACA